MKFVISDFNNSLSRSETIDAQVREDAFRVSPDGKLFDMLSLVTRQVFSSLEITAPRGQGDEVRIFMKDMGMSKSVEYAFASAKLYLIPFIPQSCHSCRKPICCIALVPVLQRNASQATSYPVA